MELFARRKDESVAASVYIDDLKAPIFKYILVSFHFNLTTTSLTLRLPIICYVLSETG